tara:strand:- start:332 stop:580 length:249 start_codon:yes stop_codon:yes gene_type:complete
MIQNTRASSLPGRSNTVHVDDGDETFAKEIGVTAIVLFGLHENLPENEGYGRAYWHFLIFDSSWKPLFVNGLRVFQAEPDRA